MERYSNDVEQNKMISDWYDHHHADLYRYAIHKLHNPELSNDCIQEVFRIATEKASELKNHKNIGGWLMQTLKNQIAMYYRSEAAKQKLFVRILENDGSHLSKVDDCITDSEISGMKEKILKNLTENELRLYDLFYVQGHKIKEIARCLDCTEAAIKMRLLRLRNKVYDEIKGFFI